MTKKDFVTNLSEIFEQEYPDAKCSLETENTLQLLISTQLSAQCRDDRVNIATKELYKRFPDVYSFAAADASEIEGYIKSLGLYKNKAKNIKLCCQRLISDFGGNVPDTMEALLSLAGVGRKTANLVLGDAFGIPSVVVDTHAIRLTNRMGLTVSKDPVKIEHELKKIIPPNLQTRLCHQLVLHGRKYCTAASPLCKNCPVNNICPKIGV